MKPFTFLRFAFSVIIIAAVFCGTAFASDFQLSGKVIDQSNNSIGNATITVSAPNSNLVITSSTSRPDGYYFVSVPKGVYDVNVKPPVASDFKTVRASTITINNNATLNFTLVSTSAQASNGSNISDNKKVSQNRVVDIGLGAIGLLVVEGLGYLFWTISKKDKNSVLVSQS